MRVLDAVERMVREGQEVDEATLHEVSVCGGGRGCIDESEAVVVLIATQPGCSALAAWLDYSALRGRGDGADAPGACG